MSQFRIQIPEQCVDIKIFIEEDYISMFSYGDPNVYHANGEIYNSNNLWIRSISFPDIKFSPVLCIYLEGKTYKNQYHDKCILRKRMTRYDLGIIKQILIKSKFNTYINPLITVL